MEEPDEKTLELSDEYDADQENLDYKEDQEDFFVDLWCLSNQWSKHPAHEQSMLVPQAAHSVLFIFLLFFLNYQNKLAH